MSVVSAPILMRLRAAQAGFLTRLISAVESPLDRETGRGVIRIVRAGIMEEFSRGGWLRPESGFVRWPRTKPFGDRPAPAIPLGGPSGRLARAWAGGSQGFSSVGRDHVEVGVRYPWAHVHRGGHDRVNPGKVTVIRPKRRGARGRPKMFWHLGAAFNVWLSKATLRRGLRVPARPHATRNPLTERRIAEFVGQQLVARAR